MLSVSTRVVSSDERHVLLVYHLFQFLKNKDQLVGRAHNVLLICLAVFWWNGVARVTREQCHETSGELCFRRKVLVESNSTYQLSHCAPKWPDVRRGIVLLLKKTNLRRAIPPWSNVIRHGALLRLLLRSAANQDLRNLIANLLFVVAIPNFEFEDSVTNSLRVAATWALAWLRKRASKSEVADPNLTLFVDEDIWRLDIPMYNVGRMKEFKRA